MTPAERDERWLDIERELVEIAAGKVTHGSDPAAREAELLDEQDRLEWEARRGVVQGATGKWLNFAPPDRQVIDMSRQAQPIVKRACNASKAS
jgi:hypothetical protein